MSGDAEERANAWVLMSQNGGGDSLGGVSLLPLTLKGDVTTVKTRGRSCHKSRLMYESGCHPTLLPHLGLFLRSRQRMRVNSIKSTSP